VKSGGAVTALVGSTRGVAEALGDSGSAVVGVIEAAVASTAEGGCVVSAVGFGSAVGVAGSSAVQLINNRKLLAVINKQIRL
jgi:hypothetical protein